MVKKPIRANSQKNTTLTAAAANPAPSSPSQRRQRQRPVDTTQAPYPQPGGADTVPAGVLDFLAV